MKVSVTNDHVYHPWTSLNNQQNNLYPAFNVFIENNSEEYLLVNSVTLTLNNLSVRFPGFKDKTQIEPWGDTKTGPQSVDLLIQQFKDIHHVDVASLIGAKVTVESTDDTITKSLPTH